MINVFTITPEQIIATLLVFARITALAFTAPVFSSPRVPVSLRTGICLLLTFVMAPLVTPVGGEAVNSLWVLAALVIKEALVGATMGYTANLVFSVVQMAGEIQDTQAGFGFAGVVDPNIDQHSAILGQFQMVLMWLIFLTVQGHHLILQALADSFTAIPLTTFTYHGELSANMVAIVTQMLLLALRIGAPLIAAVLLTDFALGMLQRTAPQLNLLSIGFQIKIAVAVLIVIVTLPVLVQLQRGLVWPFMDDAVRRILTLGR